MNNTQEMPTAGGPKPDGLKTAEPPKQAAAPPATAKESTLDLPVDGVELAGFFKVREQFSDVAELADSMKKDGQLAPVIVRAIGPARYQLVAGYRRLHAAKKAGLKTIRATVRILDDKQAHLVALAENIQRRDLSPIEEADAFAAAVGHGGWQQKDLAKALGKSEAYISNRLRLRQLPESVKEMISDGQLTAGHAEHALLKTENPKLQLEMAKTIIKQGQNVHDAERMANVQIQNQKKEDDWKKKVAASKFQTCPTDKKPPTWDRYDYYTQDGRVVKCAGGHRWRLSDGKDPDAEARSERAREAAKHRAKSKTPPAPKYYEPTTFRLPVTDAEMEKGWLRWMSANIAQVTSVEVETGWSRSIVLHFKKLPTDVFDENRMGKQRIVGITGLGTEANEKKRIDARLALEEFITKWVPGGAKKIPDEGLHGGATAIVPCSHGCPRSVKGPLRSMQKCEKCKKETQVSARPREKPAAAAKTCKAKCPSCGLRCENAVKVGTYCGSIHDAKHKHDAKGGAHDWKPGSGAATVKGAVLTTFLKQKAAKKTKASGRVKSPASPSEKRKKGRSK